MSFVTDSLLFSLPLGQVQQVTNWLTPVWMISVGIAAGYLLSLLVLVKILIGQRIPFLNRIEENRGLHIGLGFLLGAVYFGLFLGYCWWQMGALFNWEELIFPICFVIPFCLFVGFGAWSVIGRRNIGETKEIAFEGFLKWANYFCISMVVFASTGFLLAKFNGFGFLKFVDDPTALLESVGRLPYTGTFSKTVKIPVAESKTDEGFPVPVGFSGQELRAMKIETDRPLSMAYTPLKPDLNPGYIFDLEQREEPYIYTQRVDGRGMIPHTMIDNFYVKNLSSSEATLELTWNIAPVYREATIIPIVAFWTVLIFVFYMMFAALFPKIYAIALSTFKTEVGQPLYLLVLVTGIVFMVASIYIPYNTFGEDIKMYKDSGLTLIRVLAIFLAIWAASKSVAEEIEGRTALTVLSKPVGRRQFVLGKFSGITMALGLLFVVLGFWLVAWVAYKPVYDYKEAAKGLCEWTVCYKEAIHIIPGIVLCFMEVVIFVAISVAISTRMGAMANFLICASIYVLGHLTPNLVQSSGLAEIDTIVVFANLIAIVFPVADYFDVQTAINSSADVPMVYLGWSVIYTALYGSMATLLALVLFEDRDLA